MKNRRGVSVAASTVAVLGLISMSPIAAGANRPTTADEHVKVTLCHATGNGGFVEITVDDDAVLHSGHDGHDGDIIPVFAGYEGKNLTASGLATLANGCVVPGSGTTESTVPREHVKVTLCHATGNGGFVEITVDDDAVLHAGHDGHDDDIIPAFAGYEGKNLTASGLATLANGCVVPASTTTVSSTVVGGGTIAPTPSNDIVIAPAPSNDVVVAPASGVIASEAPVNASPMPTPTPTPTPSAAQAGPVPSPSQVLAQFQAQAPAEGLPTTGVSSTQGVLFGSALLLAGLGLLAVARKRTVRI